MTRIWVLVSFHIHRITVSVWMIGASGNFADPEKHVDIVQSFEQTCRSLFESILRGHPQRGLHWLMRMLAVPSAANSAAVTANLSARPKRSVKSKIYVLPQGVTGNARLPWPPPRSNLAWASIPVPYLFIVTHSKAPRQSSRAPVSTWLFALRLLLEMAELFSAFKPTGPSLGRQTHVLQASIF